MPSLLLTMVEAADELRLSRTKFYELVARGELPTVQIDGSRRMARVALERYVERLHSEQDLRASRSSATTSRSR